MDQVEKMEDYELGLVDYFRYNNLSDHNGLYRHFSRLLNSSSHENIAVNGNILQLPQQGKTMAS